jgi:hypothetical protein
MADMMPRPMGNIMAVVAVLLIHMEMTAQIRPKAKRARPERYRPSERT